MKPTIVRTAEHVLNGNLLDRDGIDSLLVESCDRDGLEDMLYCANRIRRKFFGDRIKICSIVAGTVGGCSQDCSFCAQSLRYDTAIDKKPKVALDEDILLAAEAAIDAGVPNLGIVNSGKALCESELVRIENLVVKIKDKYDIGVCAGLGILSEPQAKRLYAAGVTRYNHNLETSERHFANIVSTHKYSDRVKTIKNAQSAGMEICAGGIFGIGESDSDRVDMALALRDLQVDTVPMNFLHPIEGTPLGDSETLKPLEILRIIALYRFILPTVNLKVAGGRVLNLRDMQSWIFNAGATSILSGNYLTTAGRSTDEDMQMLTDLGLEVS